MKYFLKAPWQSKREEVTAEQYVKAKLDFAKFRHLQAPSFIPIPFISTHGVEGWVEEEGSTIEVKCPMCGFLAEAEDTVPFSMKGEYYVLTRYKCPSCVSHFYL